MKNRVFVTSGFLLCLIAGAQAEETGSVRGLIKPVQKAVISSEISARITHIPFRSGDRFKKGDTLVIFDCAFYLADLAATDATLASKQKQLENNKKLLALKAISDIDVSISESDVDIASAERRMRAIRAEQCKIRAPYAGRVIEVMANEHETVTDEKELLSILDDQNLEIELIVPSAWLTWLKPDHAFSIMIDETGMEHAAKVTKTGAVIDPVSQTIKLTGKFTDDTGGQILSGMSGTAKFSTPATSP